MDQDLSHVHAFNGGSCGCSHTSLKSSTHPDNIADSLSRLVGDNDVSSKPTPEAEEYVRFVAVSATRNAMTTREVEEASAEDEELAEVRKCINGTSWDQLVYKQYLPCSGELCAIGQFILWRQGQGL